MRGYVAGEIADYHASALLMAIFVHGMHEDELALWRTRCCARAA